MLCRIKPAGHWQPGTQGLKQWLSMTPSGTSRLKQVTGQGGPHSSNTKPLSRGQPTAGEQKKKFKKCETWRKLGPQKLINLHEMISPNLGVCNHNSPRRFVPATPTADYLNQVFSINKKDTRVGRKDWHWITLL